MHTESPRKWGAISGSASLVSLAKGQRQAVPRGASTTCPGVGTGKEGGGVEGLHSRCRNDLKNAVRVLLIGLNEDSTPPLRNFVPGNLIDVSAVQAETNFPEAAVSHSETGLFFMRDRVDYPVVSNSKKGFLDLAREQDRPISLTDDFVRRPRPCHPYPWKRRAYRSFRRSERETATFRLSMWLPTTAQWC